MKTAAELLDELNELDEHITVEAKTASEVGRSLLETVCAYANEPNLGGGYLLLGVAPAEQTFWPIYEVVGLEDSDRLQSDIASQCATMFNVPIRPRIVAERIFNKTVLVMYVSEAGSHEKPIHFQNQPLPSSAYRRIGSTDQRCTDDDLAVFYQDRRGESLDEQVIIDAEVADFDPDAIDQYRKLRKEVNPEAEELRWSDEELLKALGAVRPHDGGFKPTLAGILLFGDAKALRRFFPMMRIDYIRVPGIKWVRDPDRRFDTIEIRSPLIRAVQRARAAILDDLPRAFSLPAGEMQGQEIPLLPDRVIREVVANAVMHRSYRVHGSIQIIRYSNRLEIRNPGYSLKADERLGEPGSETRNPKIAAVFHDIRFAETKGSGIRVMRELMDERNLSPPFLQSDRTGNTFLAILLFHHFLTPDDLDWLATLKEFGLHEEEMKALVSAREVGAIDNSAYRNLNRGVDTLTASKHLRRLCGFDLLAKKGQGTATFYVPTDKMLNSWNAIQAPKTVAKRSHPADQSTRLATQPTGLPLQPTGLTLQPAQLTKDQTLRTELLLMLPEDLRLEVEGLGTKATEETLRSIVRKLCLWKDLSLSSLAILLRRSDSYLRVRVVSKMVRENGLRYTIPDNPSHPRQTYRASGLPMNPAGKSSAP